MKAIQTGTIYRVYDDSMQTHNQLPAQAYLACFDSQSGPFLKKYSDLKISEKVYGVHSEKVDKVLSSFKIFNRNLGVILSGDKGIGKSLFSKLLSIKAIESGYPLIIVNSYFPGIGEYLAEIDQEIVVLFDEFDKTFELSERGGRDNNAEKGSPQTEMLTLFDGIAQGKKLFIVTCNDINSLSKFIVNRPGRFHYHFRFEYPTAAEIEEYLMDSLNTDKAKEQIKNVIAFSQKTKLNYDCLRSIAFELNLGLTFKEAIKDLNILNLDCERYMLVMYMDNGLRLITKNKAIDLFTDQKICVEFYDNELYEEVFEAYFNPIHIEWDATGNIIRGDHIDINLYDYIATENPKTIENLSKSEQKARERYKNAKPVKLEIIREKAKGLHYIV